jgi:nucleoside-diphosphate-sugar epimerase
VEYAEGTPGDIHGIVADGSLAAACLDYVPRVSLDQGLAGMYAWYTSGRKKA